MPEEGINVATLKGLIQMDYDPGKLATFLDQLTLAKAKQISAKSEGDRLKQSFERLSASLDPAVARTLKYNQSVDVLNRSLKAGIITQATYNHNLALAKDRLQDTTTWTQRLGSEIGGSLKSQFASLISPATLAVGAVTGGIAAIGALTKKIIDVSIEAEESQNKVGAAVARYGDRAGVTADQIDNLANSLSDLTGKDDEEIASAAALSLRFNRLSGEDLPRLTAVAIDMAEVLGTDIPTAMDKAAAYTNLPLQALTKLKKEGFAVGDSQDNLVKGFLRTNDVASAQGVILDILEGQYKGAAAEARDTLGGAFEALGTTWENLLEKLGEDNLGPMRQVVEEAIRLLSLITDSIDNVSLGWYKMLITIERVKSVGNITGQLFDTKTIQESRKRIFELSKSLDELALKQQVKKGNIPAEMVAMLKLTGALGEARKKVGTGTAELTDQEEKLKDELKKQREEWEKLLAVAANAVLSSQDELSNVQALLQARKISVDAMKLQQAVQTAMTKAQAAGKAATAEQRNEIRRNTIAIFQAKNAIEEIGEAQKRATDLFADNIKVLNGQIDALVNLVDIHKILDATLERPHTLQLELDTSSLTEEAQGRIQFTADWRETWKSATDVANDEIKRVMASLLTVEEKERAIAEIKLDLLDHEVSRFANGWVGLFSTLSNLFGGFGSAAINTINQMISTFQAFQSAGSSIGGQFGSIVSSAGPFFAIAGAIVGAQRESAARDRARQYTSSATVGFETRGEFEVTGRRGRELANALESTLNSIIGIIDSSLSALPDIAIRAREDGRGFAAHINDVFLGYFATLQDAIDAAVISALQEIGPSLSETMRTVLANTTATTSEELQRDLETGLKFENLGLNDLAVNLKEMFADFRAMVSSVEELGLDASKVQVQFSEDLEKFKNDFLGIDTSAADALARLVDVNLILTEQTNRMRQQSEERLANLRAEYEAMASGPRTFISEDGRRGHTESREEWERIRRDLANQIDLTLAEIEKLPQGLSDMEIHMSVFETLFDIISSNDKLRAKYGEEAMKFAKIEAETKIKGLELQLHILGLWEQFAGMFEDVANFLRETAGEGLKPRRGRGAGGGRTGGKDEVRDFLGDRREDLRLQGLSEHARAIAELDRVYAPMLEKAGKDKKLREQLLALKDAELRQLEKENVKSIVSDFQDFLGLANGFDDVRETASGLIQRIQESTMGDPRKAQMISRVLGEMNQQIDRMSKQSAVRLFGEMAGDLISLGETEESLAGARQAMALLDHELKMDNYRTEIELIRAKGSLTDQQMAVLDDAFRKLQNIKLPTIPGGGGGGGGDKTDPYGWVKASTQFKGYTDELDSTVTDITDSLNDLAESFKSAKDDIRSTLDEISRGELGIISPELAFESAKEQYESAIKSAKAGELIGFQEASSVAKNYIEALKVFSPALASTSLPSIQEDLKLLLAAPNVKDENVIFSERFGQFTTAQEKAAALLETGFVAVTNVAQNQTVIQSQMLTQLTQLNVSNAELNARLSRLESGDQANKRNVA